MILFTLIIIISIFTKGAFASGEFTIIQNIEYKVSQNGSAQVSQEINLTNNISQIYAKEYQIKLSDTKIQNITGHDKTGDVIDKVDNQSDFTSINLKFQNPTIGKGQTNQFSLFYSIVDFAKKKGNTWEIQFPVYDNQYDTQQINALLDIPSTFGELSFSSVPIMNTHTINDRTQIQFNQNQVKGKILLIFGNHQLFDFKLNYYLTNQQSTDIITEIPLPPDTTSQTIYFQSINPLPNKIRVDEDGNWLGQYKLKPKQEIEVVASGQAKIHPPTPAATETVMTSLTKSQKYWPTNDPEILALSQVYKTPKQIYQYVVSTLNYNYDGISTASRQGALAAINNPDKALCTEFTDLFITIARANNIPSREIEGYAYSNNTKVKPTNLNSDILHAWPEYFDSNKKAWIQIDPTWEKTTNGIDYFSDLDLNHLTFVIHGQDSASPPPPGSYKKDKSTKSIEVQFANDYTPLAFTPPELTIDNEYLTITNPNLYSLKNISLTLNGTKWTSLTKFLPPMTSTVVKLPQISFLNLVSPKFEKLTFNIITSGNDTPLITSLQNKRHYLYLSISIGIIIFVLSLGGIILTASKKTNEKNT